MTVWELEERAKENKKEAIEKAQKKLKERIKLSIKDAEDRLKEGVTLADVIADDFIESLEYSDSFNTCMWIPELKKLDKVMSMDWREFAY